MVTRLLVPLAQLSIFLHLAFPKSGVKVGKVPITAADVLYLVCILLFGGYIIAKAKFPAARLRKVFMLFLLYYGYISCKVTLGILYAGGSLVDNIDKIAALLIYPLVFPALRGLMYRDERASERLVLIIISSFFLVVSFALLQYLFGQAYIMIPGLTVNWSDTHIEDPFAQKCNMVGEGYRKTVSTYQNGNLFGVNLILFSPIAIEALACRCLSLATVATLLFVVTGMLTLSRTVWAGIALYILLRFFVLRRGFRKLSVVLVACIVFVFSFAFPEVSMRWGQTPESLPTLGGRWEPARELITTTLGEGNLWSMLLGPLGILPLGSYGWAYEMTYLAVYELAGLVGLGLWLLPIVYSLRAFWNFRHVALVRGVLLGLASYLWAAVWDGGFWLPPTAFNFWFIIGFGWLIILQHHNDCKLRPSIGLKKVSQIVCSEYGHTEIGKVYYS